MTHPLFSPIRNALTRLAGHARDRSGAASIEYALLVAAIGMATVALATTLGGDLASLFQVTETKLCLRLTDLCVIRY